MKLFVGKTQEGTRISTAPAVLVGNDLAQVWHRQPGWKLQQSGNEIQIYLTAGSHSAGHTQPARERTSQKGGARNIESTTQAPRRYHQHKGRAKKKKALTWSDSSELSVAAQWGKERILPHVNVLIHFLV